MRATKRSVRVLALVLALLMLPVIGVSALAEGEGSASAVEAKTFVEENFEEKTSVGGTHEFSSLETETTENSYARIPFIGTAKAANGANGSGNYDKFIRISGGAASYETDGIVVLEAKYRPHFVELSKDDPEADNYCGYDYSANRADPTVEAQFNTVKAEGDKTQNFVSLYMINLHTGHLSMNGTRVADAQPLVADEWNTVKLVIDLAAGTYMTYVNDALYAENGYISNNNNDIGLRNVTIDADKILIAKCNKNPGAYLLPARAEEGKEYSYCDVDDVAFYRLNKETAAHEDLITTETYEGKETVSGSSHEFKSIETDRSENIYANIPFIGTATAASGANGSGNYDKSLRLANETLSYETDRLVVLEARYRPHFVELSKDPDADNYCGYDYANAAPSDPTVEAQFVSAKGSDKTVNWISLYMLNLHTGHLSMNGTRVADAQPLVADEWNTVKLIIDLVTGTYTTYVNDALYAENGYISNTNNDVGLRNVTVDSNMLIVAKCNKTPGAYLLPARAEEGKEYSYCDVDDVSLSRYTETVIVSVDGEEQNVLRGSSITLAKEGKTLLSATVTLSDGTTYKTASATIVAAQNMTIVTEWIDGEFAFFRNFEDLTAGNALSKSDGYAEVPNASIVVTEEENTFVRVPFVGPEDYANDGNWDKSIKAANPTIAPDGTITIEVDYRPHHAPALSACTVEAQFGNYSFKDADGVLHTNGSYLQLYQINLQTGALSTQNSVKAVDAPVLKLDEWNTVKTVFQTQTGIMMVYVNGVLHNTVSSMTCQYYDNGWKYLSNCTEVVPNANAVIVAKCNKNKGAYAPVGTDLTSGSFNYMDVDNIKVYESPKMDVTVNGTEIKVSEGSFINLSKYVAEGNVFLYAKVQPAEGDAYFTADQRITATAGMEVTVYDLGFTADKKVDARRGAPLGLRFTSKLSAEGFDALLANEDVTDVKIGTIIAPVLQVAGCGGFDLDALTESYGDKAYIDVPATPGEWYAQTAITYTFAGSIANIKPNHYNTEFTAVSYLILTLSDEQVVTVYSEYNPERSNTIANAASVAIKVPNLDENVRAALAVIAEAKKELEDLYKEDLKGLNVLALGDSLFSGAQSNAKNEKQWVNKLGTDLGWNLTNLGISGATISYTENNAKANKKSMWHLVEDGLDDYEWGSTNQNYFTAGNPSGDDADVQLILIEAGCNDYGTAIAAPLGDVDSNNRGTFLGAYNLMLDYLLGTYENAHIVILTTWELGDQTRPDNAVSVEYSRSVIRLYNAKYKDNSRVSLIDAGNPLVSGVNMRDANWKNTYSFDSYHLNDKGMELMAANMLPLIWNNYTNAQ